MQLHLGTTLTEAEHRDCDGWVPRRYALSVVYQRPRNRVVHGADEGENKQHLPERTGLLKVPVRERDILYSANGESGGGRGGERIRANINIGKTAVLSFERGSHNKRNSTVANFPPVAFASTALLANYQPVQRRT